MISKTARLRFRRIFRRRKRQMEDIGEQAEQQMERLFFRRLDKLIDIRRFIATWLLLPVILTAGIVLQTRALGAYYQTLRPASGGTYTEGMIGVFTNANPLYATGAADATVSRLLFGSLFMFNGSSVLAGDLASGYTVNDRGTIYTVTLKENLFWHDGMPITAEDVVFTYSVIQSPDAKSPLGPSWRGIGVKATDARTITFELPNSLSAFPAFMTNGIVPKHLLANIPLTQLRSASFNTVMPVGSGPFKWENVETTEDSDPNKREQNILLLPNPGYHAGSPKIDRFVLRTFREEERMVNFLERRELTAALGLDGLPIDMTDRSDEYSQYNIPLNSGNYLFLKNSHPILSDVKVRQALTQATNIKALLEKLPTPVIRLYGPLLRDHVGYDHALTQLPFNQERANQLLDEAGWVGRNQNDIRTKGEVPLTINLSSQAGSEYGIVIREIQLQWKEVGVEVVASLEEETDSQEIVIAHSYDALLYGLALGTDPDVFAYWHSSRADASVSNQLNLSEYKSSVADRALEAGRTRSDAALRAVKYRPFLEAWRNDAPAIALYQPKFYYLSRTKIENFGVSSLNSPVERLHNVHNWMIRQERVNKL